MLAADRGIFIIGPSGSGKTSLALSLLEHCAAHGRFGRLVSDDQVFFSAINGRLLGQAAPAIGGLVEARGLGPASVSHEPRAVVDLIVRLVPTAAAPRYQEVGATQFQGIELPILELAERNTQGAVLAIAARLSLPPFR